MAWMRIAVVSLKGTRVNAGQRGRDAYRRSRRIFQAVAQRAVEADMRDPDKADGGQQARHRQIREARVQARAHRCARGCSRTRRRAVRRDRRASKDRAQGTERKGRPGEAGMGVERERCGKDGDAFKPQHGAHPAVPIRRSCVWASALAWKRVRMSSSGPLAAAPWRKRVRLLNKPDRDQRNCIFLLISYTFLYD